jgi:hypothetical protein
MEEACVLIKLINVHMLYIADWHLKFRMSMNVSLDDLEEDDNTFIYDHYPRTEKLECM